MIGLNYCIPIIFANRRIFSSLISAKRTKYRWMCFNGMTNEFVSDSSTNYCFGFNISARCFLEIHDHSLAQLLFKVVYIL